MLARWQSNGTVIGRRRDSLVCIIERSSLASELVAVVRRAVRIAFIHRLKRWHVPIVYARRIVVAEGAVRSWHCR